MAGKVRYMDSESEEQLRGITMKSSSITLLYEKTGPTSAKDAAAAGDTVSAASTPYVINLIDSPGHVDFSTDVATAVRLCDGALVVVDVIEGVCTQTHAVLRQAWTERVKPCLVLNKVDRLIHELQMSPLEAYHRLHSIVEQVNVICNTMFSASMIAEDEARREATGYVASADDSELRMDERTERASMFSPEQGNVVFASAYDGWAFRLDQFANMNADRLGVDPVLLRRTLWGEFSYNAKTKQIVRWKSGGKSQPLFVDLVLRTIWQVYAVIHMKPDEEKKMTIVKALKIEVPKRDLQHKDTRVTLQAVFSRWLPIPKAILSMVVSKLPSPVEAASHRVTRLWPWATPEDTLKAVTESGSLLDASALHDLEQVELALSSGSAASDAPVLVFVSKVFAKETKSYHKIAESGFLEDGSEDTGERISQDFYGFARVFSGVLTEDTPIYVLGPKYNPLDASTHVHVQKLTTKVELFIMMGPDLERVESVSAGNICAIGGLGHSVLKTATLCSTPWCPSLARMAFQTEPIVRVALSPKNPSQMPLLELGLQLLNRSDPCAQILIQETGEHVILTLGELHLARCVKELEEKYAKCHIIVSDPVVGFKETIVLSEAKGKDAVKKEAASVTVLTGSKSIAITLRAVPMPDVIRDFIITNPDKMDAITSTGVVSDSGSAGDASELQAKFLEAGGVWSGSDGLYYDRILAFGPRRVGPNLLLNHVKLQSGLATVHDPTTMWTRAREAAMDDSLLWEHRNGVLSGFELGVSTGPLCDEPMWGVAFILEEFKLVAPIPAVPAAPRGDGAGPDLTGLIDLALPAAAVPFDRSVYAEEIYGPISGQIMSAMKEACREAFMAASARLVEAIYRCSMQCSGEQLGNLYAVISKRRGKVLDEKVWEGSYIFNIDFTLPVIESFGFTNALRVETSGAVHNPQLIFSHYALLDIDPFYEPTSVEDREEHGEMAHELKNVARRYVDATRKRKGLATGEKIVVAAEKQRNLSRKK